MLTKPKRKKGEKSKLEKKMDTLWSLIIRSIGVCEVCESQGLSSVGKVLNAHHIYGRRDFSLRWSVENGVCLCVSHHTFSPHLSAHQAPEEFHEWLVANKGQVFLDDLRQMRELKTYSLADLQEKYADLKRILEGL